MSVLEGERIVLNRVEGHTFECSCAPCAAAQLAPQTCTYFVVTRGVGRWVADEQGCELTFGTRAEAEAQLHEQFVPGVLCYVEEVTRTTRIVDSMHSRGPLEDRLLFWVRVWKRWSRRGSFVLPPLRARAARHFELAEARHAWWCAANPAWLREEEEERKKT